MSQPQRPAHSKPVFNPLLIANLTRPTHIYGRRRNYVYYPELWRDPVSGREYQPGYYDDTGVHYESVSFENDGKYENVVCRCPYCDTKTVLNLDAKDVTNQTLTCPNCGGQMDIVSALDDFISAKEEPSTYANTSVNTPYESAAYNRSSYDPEIKPANRLKKASRVLALALLASVIVTAGKFAAEKASDLSFNVPSNNNVQEIQIVEAPSSSIQVIPGQPVYLELQEDGYHVVNDVIRANKILYWDSSADSWYDEDSDCWMWYNTDVYPNSWQYWYEGISSDFGDYGWMEHDDEGWWIEQFDGEWIPLPEEYDDAGLWFVAQG